MKVISSNSSLCRELVRLITTYPKIAIATAWASAGTEVFKKLVQHKGRIVRAVIGTHFYQTDPDVLKAFVESQQVKFMLQPDGVFHPKVYLFWSDVAWEVVVGSPNLTAGALHRNAELSLLISSDDGQEHLKANILQIIEGYWSGAETVSPDDVANYERLWRVRTPELQKVADVPGKRPTTKPAVRSRVLSMDWPTYLAAIKADKLHGFHERLEVLAVFRQRFLDYPRFNDMPRASRQGIAGLPRSDINNSLWFGSMKGAGKFGGRIRHDDEAFSLALGHIPMEGVVTKKQYDAYVADYLKAFPDGRDGIATATRLLAMKRPDTFVCVDKANKKGLGEDIGISQAAAIDYERYWNEVILRIQSSPWWQSPEPTQADAREAWHGRTAMLDAIFYDPAEKK